MTLDRETLTVSHDGGSITITGDEIKDVTASLRSLAGNAENSSFKATVNRILFLMQEMRAIQDDIATVYNNAKGDGYNIKALRRLARIMDAAQDPEKAAKMREVSEMLEIYANHVWKFTLTTLGSHCCRGWCDDNTISHRHTAYHTAAKSGGFVCGIIFTEKHRICLIFDPDDEVDQRYLVGFCSIADEWRVTVTEENQKWLSPVPIVGDMMFPCVIQGQDGIFGALVNKPSSLYWYRKERKVVLRTYPNDQCAPLIKWDEVILPETKESL